MACKSCRSVTQSNFKAEMVIHFSGLENLHKPVVWVFPELTICTDCGTAQFVVPEVELRLLTEDGTARVR
jgi:hypothetical protein